MAASWFENRLSGVRKKKQPEQGGKQLVVLSPASANQAQSGERALSSLIYCSFQNYIPICSSGVCGVSVSVGGLQEGFVFHPLYHPFSVRYTCGRFITFRGAVVMLLGGR